MVAIRAMNEYLRHPPLLETNGGPVSLDESDHIAPCLLLHSNQAAHSCYDFALQLSSGQTFEKIGVGPGLHSFPASQPPSATTGL
ncbi:hypothetical protein IG631_08448 [Alternaria alternata]|nr:hypothetical protein IG631_08448 [Alternaria alternata]